MKRLFGFFVCLFVAFLLLIFLIPAAKKNEPIIYHTLKKKKEHTKEPHKKLAFT